MNHLPTTEKMTSLARALTTRGRKDELKDTASPWIGRAASQRSPNAKPLRRAEISLPVALLSTTNMLSYEAPDIVNAPHVRQGGRFFSSSTTASSSTTGSSTPSLIDDDSDQTGSVHSEETDATSVDLHSPDLGANDKGFFKSESRSRMAQSSNSSNDYNMPAPLEPQSPSPLVPTRAPSHSKRAHMLAHKRSIHRMSSTSQSTRNSKDQSDPQFQPAVAVADHPFGRELQKLHEVAEEFGLSARTAEVEADMAAMHSRGLVKYGANDYLDDISSIYSATYEDEHRSQPSMVWI